MSARKINQLLEQEGGCTLEQLLAEDDFCVQQCKQSHPKLMDFICQKANLQQLVKYATLRPDDETHEVAHKYPFVAMEILCSSKQVAQALCEGGWNSKADNETEEDDDSMNSENKLVRDILAKRDDSHEKKETLVEELNLTDEGKEGKSKAEVQAAEEQKNDWGILDGMINNFMQTEPDQMLSVLCGYFQKIVSSILNKENSKLLEYLLLQRKGIIFDGLMRHISHHSLAQLVIELLQVQIKPDDSKNKKLNMYQSDGSDNDNDNDDQEEPVLTADQLKMQEIINNKGKLIVGALMDQLSRRNKDNIEVALNAYSILMEFCENDHCFNLLTQEDLLQKLITVCCQGNTNNFLRYSTHLLTTIVTEFSNTDKEIPDERKAQIQQLFGKHFADITYNCVMVLYQQLPGDCEYINQSQKPVQKIGYTRLRAIELLKTLFLAIQKMGAVGKALVTPLLRAKVIDTMLWLIKTYPFCSLSHAQCITILKSMQDSYTAEDVRKLKDFIYVELEGQARFSFPSERSCSGPNMGQITQIAFALRDLTQQELNEQSSDDESEKDNESNTASKIKRKDMARWLKFCKNKIEKIEKIWSRKLEDPREPDSDSQDSESAKAVEPEHEEDDLFADFAMPRDFVRAQSMYNKRDEEMAQDVKDGEQLLGAMSKDDSDAMNKDYGQHVYWKIQSEHSIDDLMAELD